MQKTLVLSGVTHGRSLIYWILGVVALGALSQIRIPLPFTPVPITGQTFGVAAIALLMGRKLGMATVGTFLVGYSVLGMGGVTFFGPTFGYLVGMFASSFLIGGLSDRGWSQSFKKAWAASLLGSILVFALGAIGLSFFMPWNQVFFAGVLPFIPGDLVKSFLAAALVTGAWSARRK